MSVFVREDGQIVVMEYRRVDQTELGREIKEILAAKGLPVAG